MNDFLSLLVKASVIYGGLLGVAALSTLAERKFSAWMQYRVGPNRVGPFGLLQPLADGVKFLLKEEVTPDGANKWIFRLAPAMAAIPAMMTVAVVPFAGDMEFLSRDAEPLSIANIDIGLLFVFALSGLAVYGVILGGWASNSKYSLLGALRASAQMVSYELSLIMAALAVVAFTGSLNLNDIVTHQMSHAATDSTEAVTGIWNICKQPWTFVLFLIATFAETNRHPFDFAECEPELVGGFHTEYSSMKFALFFLGEYCAMIVMAALTVTLFLGGYDVPFVTGEHWTLQLLAFSAKVGFFMFLFIWVRWTLPRFRFDQLMSLGWKVFLPLALANLLFTGWVIS